MGRRERRASAAGESLELGVKVKKKFKAKNLKLKDKQVVGYRAREVVEEEPGVRRAVWVALAAACSALG